MKSRRNVEFTPAWGTQLIYREGNTAKLAYDPPGIAGDEDDPESEDCTIEMVEAGWSHAPVPFVFGRDVPPASTNSVFRTVVPTNLKNHHLLMYKKTGADKLRL